MDNMIEPISLSQITEPKQMSAAGSGKKTDSVFDDVLSNAIDALNGVSQSEFTANRLTDQYIAGKAELSDVMVATAKMGIEVQLAVTAITSAVNSLKEITQMAV